MKPDKIYIVHYTRLKDRYHNLLSFLEKCKIPYEIIAEYDKEDLSEDILKQFYLANDEMFAEKIKPLWDPAAHKPRVLNLPEISCTIKHLTAIKKLSIECTNFGLILEDDVLFDTDFNSLYKKYFNQTPENWDAVFLGEGCGVNFQNQRIMNSRKANENVYLMGHPASNCAEAYLLKPQIARKIYESAIPFQLVSDWELAYQLYKSNATTYWWYPSIVTQGSKTGLYESTLDLGQRQ
jgi:GR25 family glycosyltransferase involved in LPS biosynthesis